ncbi:GTP 3',8-cyclase MoaA [Taibaiella soli]|uniref:GTP 3',8-cyclase n=1 Tax=Taibaiella soli TaxID=1649169 RepID=A0A2W2AGZ0_9BACT|nr:GTP 3',8-cyclase MoaA [Taibaiella soli]PZF74541.1 GTP 3',8-cyclase MoaA [Taibaiella soli]
MIQDSFNRAHNYLRISLTDHCNLRCFYCMPEEDYHFTPSSKLMQADEIESLAKVFVNLGVNKIRLTGGEPLVRKDAADIINRLAKLPVKLTLTSNGSRIHEFIDVLKNANIGSINISLDTLNAEKFKLITRRDGYDQILKNIQLLLNNNIVVKINAVMMKGLNDNEINDFIGWTKDTPVHVRFIEFMPFTGNRWTSNKVFTWQEIMEVAAQRFQFEKISDDPNDTAKHYRVPGHAGTFAVISTMSAPFCGTCNRMRLAADGKMKNCLFSKQETDLLTALRNGEDVEKLIHECILQKAEALGGQFTPDFSHIETQTIQNRSMIAIGG